MNPVQHPAQGCPPERSEGPHNRNGSAVLRFAQNDRIGRRTFIRAGLLAALAGLAGLLLRRSCAGNGACNSCRQFADCGLPWKVNRP